MATGLKGSAAAIVGVGERVVRAVDGIYKTPLQLQVEAAAAAMKDAGITREMIGAVFTGRSPSSYHVYQFNQRVMNELKISPTLTSEITSHGAGALGALQYAAMALQSGVIDYALCTSGDASGLLQTSSDERFLRTALGESDPQFEAPYGPSTVALYAQVGTRYMYETGTTSEQLAKIAVENRKWALHQPDAAMYGKGEITIDDVLDSPMIASPMHRLDCAPFYRGGIGTAIILTRSELAEQLRPDPIYLAGIGQRITHEWITDRMGLWGVEPALDAPNLTRTGALVAAREAYQMAGLTNHDVDLAQTSAPFSFFAAMTLEEFGYCDPGEGGRFAEQGGIDYEGGRPFNTSGGYLSFGQSAQGQYLLLESIAQLRGQAIGRQVPHARVALVHGHGGPMACHTVVLLSSERTN
jgi:acetyl-CoA acetyltransferase